MDSKFNAITYYLFAGMLLFLSACSRDDLHIAPGPLGDGKVTLTLTTNATGYTVPVTRADEAHIGNTPLVLVFRGTDGDAVFSEAVQAVHDGTQTTVTVSQSSDPSLFVVIANPPSTFYNGNTSQTITHLATDLSGCKLSELERKLRTVPLTTADISAGLPYEGGMASLPMSGLSDPVAVIDATTQIANGGNKMTLKRAVAKAYVAVDTGLAGTFVVAGAGVFNAPDNGALYRFGNDIAPGYGTVNYVAGTDVKSGAGTSSAPLYLYESKTEYVSGVPNESTLATVIVKGMLNGVTYYYKLGFVVDGDYIDVERNMEYIFHIKEVSRGYNTLQEAREGPVSNIRYIIQVVDASAHDIVNNGQYYLGLSNSEVLNYGTMTNFADAFVITTDYDTDWGADNIILTPSVGITITSPSGQSIPVSPGRETSFPVSFSVSALTYYGTIEVKIGNLSQTVTFRRMASIYYSGNRLLPYSDYVHCEVPLGSPDWLKFRGADNMRFTGDKTFGQSQILAIDADSYLEDAGTRDAIFFAARQAGGRAKIYLTQQGINVTQITHVAEEGFYVGAFWRHNQTGERLIHIPYHTGIHGDWTAVVVQGEDWITIDMNMTPDNGVTWDTTNENPADMMRDDWKYQVPGNGLSAGGTIEAAGDAIYFRIGLRSTIPQGSQPRYGTILMSYNMYNEGGTNNTKYCYLYIRQGEEPDYLFRPTDPNAANSGWGDGITHRPYAAKISPFNITAEQYKNNAAYLSSSTATTYTNHIRISDKGVFVDYPTQAGALFQWAFSTQTKRAFHPAYPQGSAQISGIPSLSYDGGNYPEVYFRYTWADSPVAEDNESCPEGYRRLRDHYDDSNANNSIAVADSEIRQSLFLTPPANTNSVTNRDFYVGYYADGYFDRRGRVLNTATNMPAHAVSANGTHVAYRGTLFINRFNNASLFFPYSGARGPSGVMDLSGRQGYYWTSSTPASTFQAWYLRLTEAITTNYGGSSQMQYTNRNNMWYSIRCVRED